MRALGEQVLVRLVELAYLRRRSPKAWYGTYSTRTVPPTVPIQYPAQAQPKGLVGYLQYPYSTPYSNPLQYPIQHSAQAQLNR